MTILKYNSINYNIVYVDPSIESAGDGSSHSSALKTLPSPLVDETCYLIRRTTEEYLTDMQKSHNVGLRNIIFLGMPKQGSFFYDLIDEDTRNAWGSDVAEYANIRMNSNSYNDSSSDDANYTNVVYYETNTENFIAENCYFFRDGEGASSYSDINMMFAFNQSSYRQNIRFNGCKFGYTQYDIDDVDFLANNTDISTNTSKYPQNKCQGYVGVNYANTLSFNDCIFNIAMCYMASPYFQQSICDGRFKGIYVRYACNKFELNNCVINKLSREYYNSNNYFYYQTYGHGVCYGYDWRANGEGSNVNNYIKRGNAYINNLIINQILCGNRPLVFPRALGVFADNIEADNIKINLLNMKDCTSSSIVEYVAGTHDSSYMIVFGQAHGSIKVQNIEADFSNAVLQVPSMQTIAFWNICKNSLGTPSSYIRNINLKYAQDWDRLSTTSGNNYILFMESLYNAYSDQYNNAYDNQTSPNSTKSWIAENIVVDAPLNSSYSLYLRGVGVKSPKIRGRVYLWQSTLEVDELYNWYASQTGANVYGNSYLKVNNFTTELGNKVHPYIGNTQMEIQRNSRCAVYVNRTNSAIFNELVDTNVTKGDMNSNNTCLNYIADGQFMARNTYTFAKSWNVVRTGSNSNASIRFNNNSCVQSNRPHLLVVGADPYKGIEITPTSLGKKMITCYIACKNFDDVELKLGQEYCGIDVYVPETISEDNVIRHRYTSTTNGWKEDNSTWSNDANLKTFKIEIPVEVKELEKPIEVKLWYNWYSANGCVYVDPDIKLTDIQ